MKSDQIIKKIFLTIMITLMLLPISFQGVFAEYVEYEGRLVYCDIDDDLGILIVNLIGTDGLLMHFEFECWTDEAEYNVFVYGGEQVLLIVDQETNCLESVELIINEGPTVTDVRPRNGIVFEYCIEGSPPPTTPPFHADVSDDEGLGRARLWLDGEKILDIEYEPGICEDVIDIQPAYWVGDGRHVYRLNVSDSDGNYVIVRRVFYIRGGMCCFLAGTPIVMANGETKPIEKISVGDMVLSFNEKTQKVCIGEVTQTFIHEETTGYLEINELKVTSNHPLYINNEWKNAGEAQIGDFLRRIDGTLEYITHIEYIAGSYTVYNLEVESQHNYFANKILVHNKPPDPAYAFILMGSS